MNKNGMTINGRRYSIHALERMAPNTPEVRAELHSRAIKSVLNRGVTPQNKKYSMYIDDYIQSRNIPPSVVEDTIKYGEYNSGNRPGTWEYVGRDIRVIVNDQGDVITVIKK